jgi:hypothetical protein
MITELSPTGLELVSGELAFYNVLCVLFNVISFGLYKFAIIYFGCYYMT